MNQNAAGFLAVFHVWSTKQNLQHCTVQHPSIHTYRDKGAGSTSDELDSCNAVKRKYLSSRGVPWSLSNNRSEKFRETLQELEELLENQSVVCISWRNTQTFQFLLSNAAFVSINVSSDSPDVEKIFIDKTLVKRLPDYISDAIIEDNFIILSFVEKLRLALVNFSVKSNIGDWRGEGDKLALYEPKLSFIDLPGVAGFRVNKRSCTRNREMDLICVWSSLANGEVLTWSPSAKRINLSNMVWVTLIGISGVFTIEIASHLRTDGDLLDVTFSNTCSHQLLTIEQSQSSSRKYLIYLCMYELASKKVKKLQCTTIATKAELVCQARNYIQNKVILICKNGTLVLWDEYKQKLNVAHTFFLPSQISWHPNDAIFVVSNLKGDIQIFDIAMNCLSLNLVSDLPVSLDYLKLSQYFVSNSSLKKLCWACDSGIGPGPYSISCCDDIIMVFDKGPICILRLELGVCTQGLLSPLELVCEFLKYDQLNEAVSLLNSMSWNQSPMLSFQCLVLISDYVFKEPFNIHREESLENALGSFYAPLTQLTDNILQYRDDINRIARRFFHQLLANRRFEKAFLLAVDIGSKDLFMDIHYYAQDLGDYDLAEASKKRAIKIDGIEMNNLGGDLGIVPASLSNSSVAEANHGMGNICITSTPKQNSPLQCSVFEPEKFEFGSEGEELEDPVSVSEYLEQIAKSPVIKRHSNFCSTPAARKEKIQYVNFGDV